MTFEFLSCQWQLHKLGREKKVEMHFSSLHFLLGGSRQFPTQHLGFLNGPFVALKSHHALCNNLGLALSFESWI